MLERGLYLVRKYILEELLFLVAVVFLFINGLDLKLFVILLFSYVFLVLILNDTFLKKGIKKGLKDIKKEKWYWLLILMFIVLLFIWQVSIENIIFLVLFVSFALYDWDSRVVAGGALISLSLCPILLIAKQDVYAEQMAVYAYYFLVMTVVLQIIEYKRHPKLFKQAKHEKK